MSEKVSIDLVRGESYITVSHIFYLSRVLSWSLLHPGFHVH